MISGPFPKEMYTLPPPRRSLVREAAPDSAMGDLEPNDRRRFPRTPKELGGGPPWGFREVWAAVRGPGARPAGPASQRIAQRRACRMDLGLAGKTAIVTGGS